MSTAAIRAALRKRFAPPAWALVEEVRDKASHDATRSADMLAMATWKSRGLELQGIEIKASRNDWLRELKDPAKSEAIAIYCDRWWIAVDDERIVRADELPPAWGLIMVSTKGQARTVKEAPLRTADPLPRTMLATMMRRATEAMTHMVAPEDVEARVAERVAEAIAKRESSADFELGRLRERAELLAQLEDQLGVRILGDWALPNIVKALGLVRDAGHRMRLRESLERVVQETTVGRAHAESCLAELGKMDEP